MNTWKQIWRRGSIGRAILLMALVVSTIPLALFAALSIRQNAAALTERSQSDLQNIVAARATTIDLKLKEVFDTTYIAAQQVDTVLREELPAATLEAQIARYQPDARGILGLDAYYSGLAGQGPLDDNRSNVYLAGAAPPDSAVAQQIVVTERLDTLFASIKRVSPDTQWIYFTSAEGMMRLYPWASNDHYPDGWDPRQALFYTIAEPANNPELQPRWTPPYVDFAGAGWMVTLSIPVLDAGGRFLGVMSHDITISSLREIALDTDTLAGSHYGFLIDGAGGVIAHPALQPADASKGEQTTANLLEIGTPSFRGVAEPMLAGERGFGHFTDEQDSEQLLVFAPIPTIGWSLGIVVPQTEVVALATSMQRRGLLITAVMIVAAALVSFLFTRVIHAPLIQLLKGVQLLSDAADDAGPIAVSSFVELNDLARSFNEMAAKVRARETRLRAQVSELRIEIDSQQRKAQVDAVVETDFFKRLEVNAERLRNNLRESRMGAD